MKPITNIDQFLKRFDNFKDGEFRSIEVVSPTTMLVTFAAQDTARAFDWITIDLEFSGVSDAKLLENSKLPFVDMSEGITIIKDDSKFAFAIGECYNISTVKSSVCYIESDTLKYQEGAF